MVNSTEKQELFALTVGKGYKKEFKIRIEGKNREKALAQNQNKQEDGKMKRKGLVVALLCFMGLATMAIGNVEAAGWYTCTISGCGATWSDAFVTVTDTNTTPGFPANTTYVIDNSTGAANKMYAAALTAFANSTNVVLYLSNVAAFSATTAVFPTK